MHSLKVVALILVLSVPRVLLAQAGETDTRQLAPGKYPPSARSWGMGFGGSAVADPRNAVINPGVLGVWGMSFSVAHARDWESPSPRENEGEVSDLSNSLEAAGFHWTDRTRASSPRFAIGVMTSAGRHRWGPVDIVERPGDQNSVRVIEDVASRAWAAGVGAEYGPEFGLGVAWTKETIDADPPNGETWPDEFTPRGTSSTETLSGFFARVRLFHSLQRLFGMDSIIPIAPLSAEFQGSWGLSLPGENSRRGHALGGEVSCHGLPVLSIINARDRDHGWRTQGWDISVFGVYSKRLGSRVHTGDFEADSAGGSPFPKRDTRGHAVHLSGVIQWTRHLTGLSERSWASRLCSHVDVYYESAEVRIAADTGSDPARLDIREWGVNLNNAGDLIRAVRAR